MRLLFMVSGEVFFRMVKCKYCGRKFDSEHGLNVHIGSEHPDEREMVKCDYCGKEFHKLPSNINRTEHNFCSRECWSNWMKENNPMEQAEVRNKVSKSEKNRELSEEHKKHISEALKGREFSKEWREKISEAQKGKKNPRYGKTHPMSEETKRKISKARKEYLKEHPSPTEGIERSEETKMKISEANKRYYKNHRAPNEGKRLPEETKEKLSEAHEGRKISEETKEKLSRIRKELWKNPEYGEKVLSHRRPTSIEQKFIELCEQFNLPFKYVGDGEFWIENMNPDFVNVNGKKVAVEILGDYWHSEEEFEKRKEKFKEYGWKCIGIWGHELRNLSNESIPKRCFEEK